MYAGGTLLAKDGVGVCQPRDLVFGMVLHILTRIYNSYQDTAR